MCTIKLPFIAIMEYSTHLGFSLKHHYHFSVSQNAHDMPNVLQAQKTNCMHFFMKDVSLFPQNYHHCSVVTTHSTFKYLSCIRFTFKCLIKKKKNVFKII